MTISRSPLASIFRLLAISSSLALGGFRILFGLELFEQHVQPLELRLPEAAVVLQPAIRLAEGCCLDAARTALRVAAARDQPGALEHLEMFRDRRLAHGEG